MITNQRCRHSGTLYSRFDYGYKVDGAINSWTKTLGPANPVEMAFSYDPIDCLTGATYKDGAAVLEQYGYTYDKADNRTTERRNEIVSTGTFNNVNELTALSGGGVVGFTGTTTEEAVVMVGGQAAQTSLVGTRFQKAVTLPADATFHPRERTAVRRQRETREPHRTHARATRPRPGPCRCADKPGEDRRVLGRR